MLPAGVKLALGAVCIAFAPILVKCVELGPSAIGLYRCALGSLLLLAWSARPGTRSEPHAGRSGRGPALLLAGLLFAADLAVWHRSVVWAGAGMGTILGNTQVIYLGLIGLLWHKERWTWRYGVAVPLAFVGIALLVGLDGDASPGEYYWYGVVFGLLTGAIYASFLMTMRWLQATSPGQRTSQLLGLVLLVSTLALTGLCGVEGSLELPSGRDLPWLFLLALVPQVVGWILITHSLPHVPVSRSGLILLLQPALAAVLGAALFGETLTALQTGGAGITLVALYLGATRQTAKARS